MGARFIGCDCDQARGLGAELVFAVNEREVIEAGSQLHRYVYEWDIGPTSDVVTPDSAMRALNAMPGS